MLKDYADKRDFEVTPEPDPFESAEAEGPLRFVIQKHAARRLHYDLRLEWDGALKSWAVPKGFSFDPKARHLAVHVEDHPLSYASFEGQIPKGEYGGGEVIVWDHGFYSPDDKGVLSWHSREEAEQRMREDFAKGKLSITFLGKKLKGSFALVKTKGENEWLLIKHNDFAANPEYDKQLDDRSVLSGRTVEDIRDGVAGKTLFDKVAALKGASLAPMPRLWLPTSPTEIEKPFTNDEWTFELKLDGIRVLAYVHQGKVWLTSKTGKDITRKFPRLTQELSVLPSCVLDGEIVMFDPEGKPSFQLLMERFQVDNERDIQRLDASTAIEYLVFDVLYLGEWDLRKCAQQDRRAVLEELGPRSPQVRVLDTFPAEGELLFEHATQLGFEGVIGKKVRSTYQDGKRTSDWVKVKGHSTEEFLVAGYTQGEGSRSRTFGALILASRGEDGSLEFCGTVGGGFSDQQLEYVLAQLQPLVRESSPFPGPIDLKGSKPTWVEPRLFAEVKYMTRTRENKLRFPVFLRLRPDLDAVEAQIEETPMPPQTRKPTDPVESILEQLTQQKDELHLQVEGHDIRVTSLSKVLWPATDTAKAVTKRDLVAYYARMSEHLIRHLRDRPISFVRLPEGLGGERFFQKHWEKGLPDFIETVPIYSSSNDTSKPYVMINNLPTLVWLAQMSALEIHPWYSRVTPDAGAEDRGTDTGSSEEGLDESALNYPDFMVIDLDPNIKSGKEKDDEPELNRRGWDMTVQVALEVKKMLDAIKLNAYLKTSGKAGLHLYVPLRRVYDYETVRTLCETIGRHMERHMPDQVTMEWVVKKRPEKVFFDHNQNVRGKTLSGPYTVRAVPGAPVSMPLPWRELTSIYPPDFNLYTVPAYMATHQDAWGGILEDRQVLPGTE